MQNTVPFESPLDEWLWYDWFAAADGLPRQPFHTVRVAEAGRWEASRTSCRSPASNPWFRRLPLTIHSKHELTCLSPRLSIVMAAQVRLRGQDHESEECTGIFIFILLFCLLFFLFRQAGPKTSSIPTGVSAGGLHDSSLLDPDDSGSFAQARASITSHCWTP